MHDKNLVSRAALTRLHHDLLQEGEEDVDKLVESCAVLLDVELICLEDLLEGHEARNQNRLILDALLNSVAHLLNRSLPIFREVDLSDVEDDAAECSSIIDQSLDYNSVTG